MKCDLQPPYLITTTKPFNPMPKCYDDMCIEKMIEKAQECINNMNRESEKAERSCANILAALEFIINENNEK